MHTWSRQGKALWSHLLITFQDETFGIFPAFSSRMVWPSAVRIHIRTPGTFSSAFSNIQSSTPGKSSSLILRWTVGVVNLQMTHFTSWRVMAARAASWKLTSISNSGLEKDSSVALGIFTIRYTCTQYPEIGVYEWVHQMDELLVRLVNDVPCTFRHQLPWYEATRGPVTLTMKCYSKCFSANEKSVTFNFLVSAWASQLLP